MDSIPTNSTATIRQKRSIELIDLTGDESDDHNNQASPEYRRSKPNEIFSVKEMGSSTLKCGGSFGSSNGTSSGEFEPHPKVKRGNNCDYDSDVISDSKNNSALHSIYKFPPPFYLLEVLNDNTGKDKFDDSFIISLKDIISPDASDDSNMIKNVTLFNFQLNLSFLIDLCPNLFGTPLLVITDPNHFDHKEIPDLSVLGDTFKHLGVFLPDAYGTHHSKFAIVEYDRGVRIAIFTSNFIQQDLGNMTNGVYIQDFPKYEGNPRDIACNFSRALFDYLNEYRFIGYSNSTCPVFEAFVRRLNSHDFRTANVDIVASVPGRHKGSKLLKWGHMRLKTLLNPLKATYSESTNSSGNRDGRNDELELKTIFQCSSISSLGKDEKFIDELENSMNISNIKTKVELVWPTHNTVCNSIENGVGGASMPSSFNYMFDGNPPGTSPDNGASFLWDPWSGFPLNAAAKRSLCESQLKRGLQHRLHTWDGTKFGRNTFLPHMKCFFQYKIKSNIPNILWFILTSHNLSAAAWGKLEKDETQLYIKSYELGVLFLPPTDKYLQRTFSCTPTHAKLGLSLLKPEKSVDANSSSNSIPIFTSWDSIISTKYSDNNEIDNSFVFFPIPFQLPPKAFDFNKDFPWFTRLGK